MSRSVPKIVLLRENPARGTSSSTIETRAIAETLSARGFKTRTLNAEMPPTRLAKKLDDQRADAGLVLLKTASIPFGLVAHVAAWVEGLKLPLIGPSSRCWTLCSHPETTQALLRGLGLPVLDVESANSPAAIVPILADPDPIALDSGPNAEIDAKAVLDRLAIAAFQGLECRDFALITFEKDSAGLPRIVSVDPRPSFEPGSPWRIAVDRSGRDFADVLASLARRAITRGDGV